MAKGGAQAFKASKEYLANGLEAVGLVCKEHVNYFPQNDKCGWLAKIWLYLAVLVYEETQSIRSYEPAQQTY